MTSHIKLFVTSSALVATILFGGATLAFASVSVSVQSLSPATTIAAGTHLTFTVSTAGFTNPVYTVTDTFAGSSETNANINSSGNFSWTPLQSDVGTHSITITVTDSLGNNAAAQEQITVGAGVTPTVTIQSLSPSTNVNLGQMLTFTAVAAGFSGPTYSVTDSFTGSSATNITNNNINTTTGAFTWIPSATDIGTHTITVTAIDGSGHTATTNQTVTVGNTGAGTGLVIQGITPGTTVQPNGVFSFNVTPLGFTNPVYTVTDSFSGTSVTSANMNPYGTFVWTPTTYQQGSHTITVYATDSYGHSAQTSVTVSVGTVNTGISVTTTSPAPSSNISPGTMVTMQGYAYGFSSPTFTVQDSFSGTSVTSANMNYGGYFSWTPTVNDVGTHALTIAATDSYGHTASTGTTVTVSTQGTVVATNASLLSILQAQLAQLQARIATLQGGTSVQAAPVTNSYTFTQFLHNGSQGSEVRELQNHLTALGIYNGPVTGVFGVQTEAAVKRFQSAHGIRQAGYVGPSTRDELNR